LSTLLTCAFKNVDMLKRNSQGYFYIDVTIKGRRKRKQLGRDRATAMILASELLTRPVSTFYSNDEIVTTLEEYINNRPLRSSYKETLQYDLVRFVEWCQSNKLSLFELTEKDAVDYINESYAHLAPRTYNKVLNELRSWYNVLIRRRMAQENPFKHLENRPVTEEEYQVLDEAQQHALRTHPFIYRDFFTFLLETGMRENDAWNLKRADINLKKRTARYTITKSSTNKIRFAPLSTVAIKIINERYTDYIFPELSTDNQRRFCRHAFKVLVCDIDAILHWTRHTFANNMLNKGVPLEVLRDILGHSSITMTEKYAKRIKVERLHKYLE